MDQVTKWITKLEEEINSSENKWLSYWKAYGLYQLGIFHMVNDQDGKAIDKFSRGIETLESLDDLDSEDLTLLASLYGISIQY